MSNFFAFFELFIVEKCVDSGVCEDCVEMRDEGATNVFASEVDEYVMKIPWICGG